MFSNNKIIYNVPLYLPHIRPSELVKVHRHSRRCYDDGLRFADREFLGGDPVAGLHRYVLGLAADHGDFRKSKFIRSWVYMLVYFLIIIISFWIGVMMDISEDNAKAFVSWITWAMIWFYGTNVLKNMGKVFPDNKVIAFLYWVAAVKFISKVNFLDEFNKTKDRKAPQIQKDRGAGCKTLCHACHRL